jgi:pimeloyl-ACP methyl ester carboxylesterase
MPHVAVNDTKFFYQQAGQGPDVVLLHAVTGNLAVWMFINIIETLATEFRVTAYDLRGHGGSDVTPTGYTSADMAQDFRSLSKALGLGPAFLVGHSFGGVVAMHAAVLYPELVAGLILCDSFFPGLAHIEPNTGETVVWHELRAGLDRCGIEIGQQVNFTRLFRTVAMLTPAQTDRIKNEMGAASWRWLAQLPRLAPTTCGDDVFEIAGLTAEQIASVRLPVIALYDEHTPFLATRCYLQEHLPNCQVDVVPGARHVAPLQNPAAFVQLVQKHLRNLAAVH